MESIHETIDLVIASATFVGTTIAIIVGFIIFVRISVVKLNQKNNQIALDILRLEKHVEEVKNEMDNKLREHTESNQKDDSTLRRSIEMLYDRIEKNATIQDQKDEKLDGKIQGLYDKIDSQIANVNSKIDGLKDFIIVQIKKN